MQTGEVFQDESWAGSNVISIYTRKQAIADGVLVDLSSSFPRDTGMFKWNVACTDSVWTLIERAAEADGVDAATYVYDVSFMAFMAIKTMHDAGKPELFFKVMLPLRESGSEKKLKLHCGPGDAGEPVLTIMLPEED